MSVFVDIVLMRYFFLLHLAPFCINHYYIIEKISIIALFTTQSKWVFQCIHQCGHMKEMVFAAIEPLQKI